MSINKNYQLPTNKWLKPLEVLFNENNLVISSQLIGEIKKEKVVVKITRRESFLDKKSILDIYETIKKSPHIIKIYGIINCNENTTILNSNYKNALGFCPNLIGSDWISLKSGNGVRGDPFITLEIMKKYSYSLNKLEKKLDIAHFEQILKYLLLIQLELFNLYGFIHKDIHLGNVLVEKPDVSEIFFYIHSSRDPQPLTSSKRKYIKPY